MAQSAVQGLSVMLRFLAVGLYQSNVTRLLPPSLHFYMHDIMISNGGEGSGLATLH